MGCPKGPADYRVRAYNRMTRRVEHRKERSEAVTEHAKVLVSFLTAALSLIAGLFSTLAAGSGLFKLPEVMIGVVASMGAASLTAGFTAILARRERGTSRLAKLKDELSKTYLDVLERSRLNPVRGDQG